ncbi:uncharacterized protein LOC100205880 isoform X2 [Hydra vulgaris]|uniref:RNA helicase n=1 Tax=Hydra vulgaris TaxID=6087 RepID=A0ABM4DL28_HYDVU
MQVVSILKFEHAGKFSCRPSLNEQDFDGYLDYLASLNTYYDNNDGNDSMCLPQIGKLYAAYTSFGDSDKKLWYRGKMTSIFTSIGGFVARLFLVDEGHTVCVTKARLRVLHSKFQNFPHQFIQCLLDGIVPVSLSPDINLQMSMQKSQYFDNSAAKFVDNTINGKITAIKVVSENSDCSKNVILYVQEESSWYSVNEMLVNFNFASYPSVPRSNGLNCSNDFLSNTLNQTNYDVSQPDVPPQNATKHSKNYDTFQHDEFQEASLNNSSVHLRQTSPLINKPELQSIETFNNCKTLQKQTYEHQAVYNGGNYTISQKESYEQLTVCDDFDHTISQKLRDEQQEVCRSYANKDSEELQNLLNNTHNSFTPKNICNNITLNFSEKENSTKIQSLELKKKIPCKENNEAKDFSEILPNNFQNEQVSPKNNQFGMIDSHSIAPKSFSPFVFLNSNESSTNDSDLIDAYPVLKALSVGCESSCSTNTDDIFVHGKLKRAPFERISNLNLPLPLKRNVIDLGFERPTQFQSHLYPAVVAFRHIVCIPEPNSSYVSKILAYILPITKCLVSDENKSFGKGNGPIVLICVSDWVEAQRVYDVCSNLVSYYKKTVRVDIFYGGMGSEEEHNIRLINGCEILVVTMPALIRILYNEFTNLKRLRYLIFDNADILVEKYTEDIKIFMRLFVQTLKEMKRSESTQQIIVIAKKWSYGVRSFMNSYLAEPLVIIGNKIEAALFAEVPMVVQLCNSVERLDYLIGFLETDANDKNTIIFTNSANNADELQEQLTRYSIFSNVITEFMSPSSVKDVKLAWNASLKKKNNFLIMSDKSVLSSGIKNGSCVVHYDFCCSKSDFGNRLNCLQEVMRENEDSVSKKELCVLIFVTELDNGMRYSTGLVKLLKRSGQEVSEELQSMAISSHEIKESQKEFDEFCHQIKMLGYCNDINDCIQRHTAFPQQDFIGLCPSAGYVKVVILAVINASSYWGRIIEHNLPFKKENTSYPSMQYVKLAIDIQLYYANKSFHQQCVSIKKYDMCVVKTECGYQRVRIDKIVEKELERPKKFQVFGIDSGMTLTVMYTDLLVCPLSFQNIPPQAVEIIVCSVKPIDSSSSWTNEASLAIEKMVLGKTLEGRVQFSLQNTIWVDPLLEKDLLSGVQTKTYVLDVGRDLIYLGYGEKNSKHVSNLRKLLYDVHGRPMDTNTQSKMLPRSMIEIDSEYLHDDYYEDVYISSVVNPSLFYVQKVESFKLIEKLDNKIQATMAVKKLEQNKEVLPIGYICAAQYSSDKKWYRGKVCGVNTENNEYDIFFVDHGDREWLSREKIALAWDDLLNQPFHAIECTCSGVLPNDEGWTDLDGDIMWEIIVNRLLSVKVISTLASTFIDGMIQYEVEIMDNTCNPSVNINHELVVVGAAKASLQCLKELFPNATLNQSNEFQSLLQRCDNICVEIYKEQKIEDKLIKCNQLKNIVLDIKKDDMVKQGCVYSVCKLFSLAKDDALIKILLECLQHFILVNKQNCIIFFEENTLKTLCVLLRRTDNEELQNLIFNIMPNFCDQERFLQCLNDNGFVNSSCRILKATSNSEVILSILKGIYITLKKDDTFAGVIRHEGALDTMMHFLERRNNDEIVLQTLETLSVCLSGFRDQEYFCNIGGLKSLFMLMKQKPSEKIIQPVLQIFQEFVSCNEKSRDYLHKMAVHDQLKIFVCLPMRFSVSAKKLMNSLIAQLSPIPKSYKVIEKKENVINSKIVECSEKEVIKISNVTPKVLWSQRNDTVTLSIQLRDVKSEETVFTPTSLKFRTILNQVEYVLDLQLYRQIVPEKCCVSKKSSEVLIILYKDLSEIWLRLPKSPKKASNISIDHDRWCDSEDDDEEATFETWYRTGCLPPPPECTAYQPGDRLCVAPLNVSDSSSDEQTSESDEDFSSKDYFSF